ncbi:MAG: NAD(P)/FAD-dependent oxidoreductase [Candidatus Hodarchaeales archaeon]
MENKFDVLIIGAGTAGSYFAWKLAERGHNIVVIEKRKLGTLGAQIDIFHMDEIRFNQFGIPLPEGDELVGYYPTGLAWPPDGDNVKTVDYAFYVMRLPLFIERLQKYAKEAGVKFYGNTEYRELIINDQNRIIGCKVEQDGETKEFYASLIVDCSGIDGVVRVSLPPEFQVETDKIKPEDMLYVILQYWDEIEGDGFPRGLNFYPYHKTFCNPSYGEGAILGVGQSISFDNAEKIQKEFLEERFSHFSYKLIKTGKGRVPFRRTPYSFVSDNFLVLGDAAFTNKPFSGEGVTSGFTACKIAVEEIDKVLGTDKLTREALWNINVRYFRDQGAKFAELLAQLPVAAGFSRKDVNFLFKNDIIFSGKALSSMNRDFENKISTFELLTMIRKFIWGVLTNQFSFRNLSKLLTTLSVSGKLRKHYEKYPVSPEGFELWAKKAQKLWDKVG